MSVPSPSRGDQGAMAETSLRFEGTQTEDSTPNCDNGDVGKDKGMTSDGNNNDDDDAAENAHKRKVRDRRVRRATKSAVGGYVSSSGSSAHTMSLQDTEEKRMQRMERIQKRQKSKQKQQQQQQQQHHQQQHQQHKGVVKEEAIANKGFSINRDKHGAINEKHDGMTSDSNNDDGDEKNAHQRLIWDRQRLRAMKSAVGSCDTNVSSTVHTMSLPNAEEKRTQIRERRQQRQQAKQQQQRQQPQQQQQQGVAKEEDKPVVANTGVSINKDKHAEENHLGVFKESDDLVVASTGVVKESDDLVVASTGVVKESDDLVVADTGVRFDHGNCTVPRAHVGVDMMPRLDTNLRALPQAEPVSFPTDTDVNDNDGGTSSGELGPQGHWSNAGFLNAEEDDIEHVYANVTSVEKKRLSVEVGGIQCGAFRHLLVVSVVAVIVTVIVLLFGFPSILGIGDSAVVLSPTVAPTLADSNNRTDPDNDVASTFLQFFETLSDPHDLRNQSTPQYGAYQSIVKNYAVAGIRPDDWERLQQRYVMFMLHFGVGGREFDTLLNLYEPSDHECDMNSVALDLGIFCDVREDDGFRFITTIRLPVDILNGQIQNEIYLLPHLRVFDVASNVIGGTIPSTFGLLKELEELRLGRNYFRGSIPSELGQITTLKVLSLSYNTLLTGTVPTTLGQLTNLQTLDLSRNPGIVGTLPSELSSLTSLDYLFLQEMPLRGTMNFMCDAGQSYHGFLSDCGALPNATSANEERGRGFSQAQEQPKVECSCCTGCYADWHGTDDDNDDEWQCPPNHMQVRVRVNSDGNGHETTWDLDVVGSEEIKVAKGGTYFSRRAYRHYLCVPKEACYSWSIYDRNNNAMCCLYGQGSFALEVNGETLAKGFRPTSAQFGEC